ncbi:hypothetical protein X927_06050 [Petrotoga mexicana DSM 14811]|uniref:Uncharacterized protein n=1 Tax=Petrotoga mexicana DSM 14811 TaxID=1122954 RepID=A0A2K1P8V9_9BACT|nr:hypothetical protein X927_06050 [Petrotoga mexicana DSM 14811]
MKKQPKPLTLEELKKLEADRKVIRCVIRC